MDPQTTDGEHQGGAEPRQRSLGPRRVVHVLTTLEIGIAGLAAAMIFVLILTQTGQRYLPIDGWTWTGELARYCLVWMTFSAAGVLVTRDGHIALQIVDQIRIESVLRAIHVLAMLVVCACGVGFALACLSLIEESRNLTTPSLGIPMRWIYVLPLIGFISTAIRSAVAAGLIAVHGVARADESDQLATPVNGLGTGEKAAS